MVPFARTLEGMPVYPEKFNNAEWEVLKSTYKIGDLLTACCSTPAVPKTSINGIQFFAHLTDECATSPESQWHLSTKDLILRALERRGVTAIVEHTIMRGTSAIKSDVYCEWSGRRIAIEVQHSYQTFKEYLHRQDKYRSQGIENYWLLYRPRYFTLCKSIMRLRMTRDFGGKYPPGGFFAVIPELPIVLFDPEIDGGLVDGGSPLKATLPEWIDSLLNGSFRYVDGAWRIS